MTAYMHHKDLANESIDGTRRLQIVDGVHRVLDGIARAEEKTGRTAGSVRLLAATKTRDVAEIMTAIDAGVRMIGENRPQEVVAKADGLSRLCAARGLLLGAATSGVDDADGRATVAGTAGTARSAGAIPFHLIGQLQSNKIGKILPVVDVVESVGSYELAERISRRAVARGIDVGVLLEVNESGEAAKSGCEPDLAVELAERVATLPSLNLQGLMTIGAHVDDAGEIRRCFAHLRESRDAVLASGEPGTGNCRELSMGMTHDMDLAIEEGSTIVRVGTAIFGPRAFV